MKSLFKRGICFLATLGICLSTLPLIFSVADTSATEPELSALKQIVISQEGVDTNFGTAFNNLHANTKIVLSESLDLSAEELFVFDLYIENIEALNTVIDNYSGSNQQGLVFALSSAARETNFARRNYVTADITNQIIQNGWNEIKISKDDFIGDALNWSGVKYAYLMFSDYNAENDYSPLNDITVKLRNICSVFPVPEIEPESVVLYEDILFNTLGDNEEYMFSSISDRFKVENLVQTDFSSADIISLDIKFSDYSVLKTELDNNNLKLNLVLYSINGNVEISLSEILKAGEYNDWYHADILTKNIIFEEDFDLSAICGFSLAVCGDNTDVQIGDNYKIELYITNVSARSIPNSLTDTSYGFEISNFNVEKNIFIADNNYSDFVLFENGVFENITDAEYMEFDIYVSDYEKFIKSFAEDVSGNNVDMSLDFVISNDEECVANTITWADVQNKVICNGWNHIILPLTDAVNKDFDLQSGVKGWKLSISGENLQAENPYYSKFIAISNMHLTKYQTPETQCINDILSFITKDGQTTQMASIYKNSSDMAEEHMPVAADITGATSIEFDLYVQNYDAYKKHMAEKGVTNLILRISSNKNQAFNEDCVWVRVADYIKKSGWNHISISYQTFSKGSVGALDEKNVDTWQMYYAGNRTATTDNLQGQYFAIANMAATAVIDPKQPENVINQLGTAVSHTLGNKFHYTPDRIFEEKISPVDFSLGPAIEFDLYVEDYGALMSAIENSELGVRLAFFVSSTPTYLWGQYTKPRSYYNTYVDITDMVTKSGWNHIRLGKADFIAFNHVIDWSGLTAWYIRFLNTSNREPEVNPAANVMVRVCNIVNTGVVANIPKDDEKASKPDKDAAYISSADMIADSNGTWNPSSVVSLTDYKTEGKASIALELDYNSNVDEAQIYYLLDETAAMDDLKTLKFDFFIDLPQNIKKVGNLVEVLLSDSRTAADNYYLWNINIDLLQQGWNSLSFDLDDATVKGSPNINEIKTFYLRFKELNLRPENFEEILISIDNLRYISSAGNTLLRINTEKVEEDTVIETDEEVEDTVIETDKDVSDIVIENSNIGITDTMDTVVKENEVSNEIKVSQGKTKYIKNIKKIIKMDYLTGGIILGAEAVVYSIGALIFIIIYRKKRKN